MLCSKKKLAGVLRGQERGRDFSRLNHSNALYMQTFPSAAYIPNLYGSPKKKRQPASRESLPSAESSGCLLLSLSSRRAFSTLEKND